MINYELICFIVNDAQGIRALKIARKNGADDGIIFLGKGTVKSRLLDFLDLNDIQKEILIILGEREMSFKVMECVSKEMAFHKQNHGIAFSVPLIDLIGKKNREYNIIENMKEGENMHNAIFVVVDRGIAEEVVSAAQSVGARGGTIINSRESDLDNKDMVFHMPIEPEKEIVLILAEKTITDNITNAIRKKLNLDEPGNGVLFVVGASKTYGLY